MPVSHALGRPKCSRLECHLYPWVVSTLQKTQWHTQQFVRHAHARVFNSTTVVSTRLNDGITHMQCKMHACRLPYLPHFGSVQLQMLTGRRHGIEYIVFSYVHESIPGDNWSPVFTCKRADSQVRPSNAPRPLQTHAVPFASPNTVLEPCEGLYSSVVLR